jgi:hypothetical protein
MRPEAERAAARDADCNAEGRPARVMRRSASDCVDRGRGNAPARGVNRPANRSIGRLAIRKAIEGRGLARVAG